ncbi:MAG TPA: 3-oxoadipate enol-lactonase [Beijerinckiaceae bacterium]|nr:3-oxoadipate enol-lactonase [Beijerinckiaceae bacterium]
MPTINANGVELFYELTGPEDAPVVVFSTSVGATIEMWDPQVRALGDRFRLLRYDTRGHGRSQVIDRPTSIEELADDLAGLLDALGIAKAHLVGLSLGGMTGQALALRHPDKLESLVLLATSAYLPPAEAWTERAATVRAKGMAAIADTVMSRWFTRAFTERAPGAVAATRERFIANDANGYAICCEAIRDMDLRPAIGAVRTPTLILAGADDPATPVAMMEDIRTRIPDAEMIIVPRAAHLLNLERPEIVNAHLAAFLARFAEGRAASSGGVGFEAGLANRKAVLGAAHVERSLAKAGDFGMPWQDFITRIAWGEIWGDKTIPWKTRSMLTLAMMIALHREEEFKLHVRPALKNGVTTDELRALILQAAIYAGVPAANAAFRWVKDVLGEELR